MASCAAVDPAAEPLDPRPTVGLDHHVLRAEMPVRDALAVGVLDRVGDAGADTRAVHELRSPSRGQQLVHRPAVDALDGEVADVAHAPGLEHRDDVRVVQSARGLRLAHEGLLERRGLGVDLALADRRRRELHRLDQHIAVHHMVGRQVGRAGTVAPELAQDQVTAELARRVAEGGGTAAGGVDWSFMPGGQNLCRNGEA